MYYEQIIYKWFQGQGKVTHRIYTYVEYLNMIFKSKNEVKLYIISYKN